MTVPAPARDSGDDVMLTSHLSAPGPGQPGHLPGDPVQAPDGGPTSAGGQAEVKLLHGSWVSCFISLV